MTPTEVIPRQVADIAAAFHLSEPPDPQANPVLKLPQPRAQSGRPLMESLRLRQSARAFSDRELELQVLSELMWAACGINRGEGGTGSTGGYMPPSMQHLLVRTSICSAPRKAWQPYFAGQSTTRSWGGKWGCAEVISSRSLRLWAIPPRGNRHGRFTWKLRRAWPERLRTSARPPPAAVLESTASSYRPPRCCQGDPDPRASWRRHYC